MPTLVRLFIVLIVLGVVAFGGMLALSVFIDPGEKVIRVKIPPQQLGVEASQANSDPLGIRNSPQPLPGAATTTTTTEEPADEPPPEPGTQEVDIPE
jgi:hypothetical protein